VGELKVRAVIFIFLIAMTITGFSTPWVRRLAIWLGFVDAPAQRKLHSAPTPLMGGLAIFGGAFLAVFVIFPGAAPQVRGILLASGIVALVGLWDDHRRLSAWAKLAGQFAGFLVLLYFGVQIDLPVPVWLNYTLTFFWLAAITNAINFLDNMDGLSAGVSGVAAAFIMLMAALNNQYLVASLAAAIVGSCFGFLRYNFKPAQIFMGDAGALFLGFLLAVLGLQLRFPDNTSLVTWMVPVFILGLPIFDTALVVISRLRRHVNPFTTAGKDHFSHRLVNLGFTQREAVLILYLITAACGMIAIFISRADLLEAYTIGLTAVLLAAYGLWRLEWRVHPASLLRS
jgi:UDP-GlcNAc:undecaprenyl-phosphate/decaprenyl-phosphate GlcNAc-1-phosphate transferase